jgi:hypothetical protein
MNCKSRKIQMKARGFLDTRLSKKVFKWCAEFQLLELVTSFTKIQHKIHHHYKMPLEITLLPEFGWSIKDQPVYGPGSVFQGKYIPLNIDQIIANPSIITLDTGFVKANISESQLQMADRLRIIFHATESTYSSGYATPIYHTQLFGSQKVLWKRKDLGSRTTLTPDTDISIPFILQMPMIQFPPSANVIAEGEGLSYHSNFMLSAYLDSQTRGEAAIIKAHKTILYMPFIETSISKKPISITTMESTSTSSSSLSVNNTKPLPSRSNLLTPTAHVSMSSLDYVPGDTMPITLLISNIAKKSVDSISAKLYQIQTWNKSANNKGKTSKGDRKVKQPVAQNNITLQSESSSSNIESSSSTGATAFPISTSLELPLDLIPTFTYSPVFSIIYQLQISIKRKGKLWSFNFDLADIPVTIGTLGYGIRSSEDIKFYSTFRGVFDQGESSSNPTTPDVVLPVPKFLNVVEYEESLPVYNEDRLPSYESSFASHHHQHMGCIM